MNRPKVGLALSGGGARGLAHIGVLKVLEREGIPIGYLSGASMGGILAAAYAAGLTPDVLESLALRMSHLRQLVRLVDLRRPRRGLLAGEKLRAFLAQYIPPELTFADLSLPLALEATDLRTGEEVALTEGSVLEAVLATSAYPGVLPPVVIDGHYLVDGGVLDNLPVDLVRLLGAERVIAVDVSSDACPDSWDPLHSSSRVPDFLQMAFNAVGVMVVARTRAKLLSDPPEVLIRPCLPHDIGTFSSFTRAAEIIRLGEQAAEHALFGLLPIEELASLPESRVAV
jgi:NTE family protein